jgi:hypothetical protein
MATPLKVTVVTVVGGAAPGLLVAPTDTATINNLLLPLPGVWEKVSVVDPELVPDVVETTDMACDNNGIKLNASTTIT